MHVFHHELSNAFVASLLVVGLAAGAVGCGSATSEFPPDGSAGATTTAPVESTTSTTEATTTSASLPALSFEGIPDSLAKGTNGESTGRVQVALDAIGCGFLGGSGQFGDATARAIRTLEANNKLPVDGTLNAPDLAKLKELYTAGNTHCGLDDHGTWPEAYEAASRPTSPEGLANGCEPGSTVYAVKLDDPESTAVSFTFDDGPDDTHTPKVLSIMTSANLPATFFEIGQQVQDNPKTVKSLVDANMEIGNHTMTHVKENIAAEVAPAQEVITSVSGHKPRYFRSPTYAESPGITKAIKEQGLCGIHTSPDAVMNDWVGSGYDADKVVELQKRFQRATSNKGMGNFIVLHDGGDNQKIVEEALPGMIAYAKAHGVKILGLQEMLTAGAPITEGPAIQDN